MYHILSLINKDLALQKALPQGRMQWGKMQCSDLNSIFNLLKLFCLFCSRHLSPSPKADLRCVFFSYGPTSNLKVKHIYLTKIKRLSTKCQIANSADCFRTK